MSRKTILVAAGVFLTAGAIAAIAHGGRGGGRAGGEDMLGKHGGWHERGSQRMGDRLRGRMGLGVTEAEWGARTRERFARLDANSDGAVTRDEVSDEHRRLFNLEPWT